MADTPDPDRRTALKGLIVAGSAVYAAALAVPSVQMAIPASRAAAGERWIRVARLADLEPGVPRRVDVVADERDAFTVTPKQLLGSVWLQREGEGVKALSVTCPHLGCAIDLTPDRKAFACPCHTSRFALGGAAEAGPSPRGMDALATRVVDGQVEIDFRRFRTGTSSPEPIG